jgi:hypothetical protein
LLDDKVAAAHMLYFLISAALFIPMIGGMVYFMRDVTDSQIDDGAGLEPQARVLLDRLTTSPGWHNKTTGTLWQDRQADDDGNYGALGEAGIRHDTHRFRLSHEKIANLQRGGLIDDQTTPFVDYPELKAALGLDERFDFHLRLSPTGYDRRVDPYGSQPLGATHVAYIGKLDDAAVFTGDLGEFHEDAEKEIQALHALGLGPYKEAEAGFTDTAYYPLVCSSLGVTVAPTQHGTVIADTTKVVRSRDAGTSTCLLNHEQRPYPEWFLQNYFLDNDGGYRFDVLVFGSGVDLERWFTTAMNHDNASIDEHLFMDFVAAGGTIIFLDNHNLPPDFVTDCAQEESHCLFSVMGQQGGLNIPDDTNQMLFAPNRLAALPTRTTPWMLVEHHDGLNESAGFIPMVVPDPFWEDNDPVPSYLMAHVGATSSDRYGGTGGSVILSNWNLSHDSVSEADVSRALSNFLSYGVLRTAYLDYGPQLPDDRAVRAAAKTGILELPTGEFVEIRVQLYLWRS